MEKKKVSVEESMELARVIEYLENLAASFKSGKVVVEKDGEFVSLEPPATVDVEVEAKTKKDKSSFSLELSWREASGGGDGPKLTISSEEPEPAEPEEESGGKDDDGKEGKDAGEE